MGRILVIRGGAIGDFILTLPAIGLLREKLPENEIEILGYRPIISLAEAAGLADRTRSIEHGSLAAFFIPNGVLDPDWIDYFASFDLIVSYLYDPNLFFQSNLEKCGSATILACSHRISEPGDHAAAQLAKPLEQIALYLKNGAPDLQLKNDPKSAVLLGSPSSNGIKSDTDAKVAIHPGSGGTHKIWPTENWISLIRELARSHPKTDLILITGEAEFERGITAKILEGLKGIPFEHIDSTPLPELAAALSNCDLFLGHDSGISHLAAACGIPCLLLFGPTDPKVWAPQNRPVRIVEAPDRKLASLPVATVAAQVTDLLDG